MNIQTALDRADEMKPNMMSRELKIAALSELDGLIHREIILKHWHLPKDIVFKGYTKDTDPGTELLAPWPYDEMYTSWLMARIDQQNLEMDKYENDRIQFNAQYERFQDFWRRTHMPLSWNRQLRI